MPISQATILAIYGDLCDLIEKIETLDRQAFQPGLFDSPKERTKRVYDAIGMLRASAAQVHRQAINHITRDDPALELNPITGRLDE